jgi:NTP pyrophosphatase (non-canonical NTP hydrolase)
MNQEHAKAVNQMAIEAHQLSKEKGWYDKPETEAEYVARCCANMHGEISELWEALRKNQLRSDCDKADEMEARHLIRLSCVEEELADIVIRAMDMAERLNIDLGRAIINKHAFNETRQYRHGGKAA